MGLFKKRFYLDLKENKKVKKIILKNRALRITNKSKTK